MNGFIEIHVSFSHLLLNEKEGEFYCKFTLKCMIKNNCCDYNYMDNFYY